MSSKQRDAVGLREHLILRALGRLAAVIFVVIALPGTAPARHRLQEPSRGHQAHPAALPFVAECLMEPITGAVLVGKNIHQPWPTASLAKMMLISSSGGNCRTAA